MSTLARITLGRLVPPRERIFVRGNINMEAGQPMFEIEPVPTLSSGPEVTPVSVAEVKTAARIDHDFEDDFLQTAVEAATAHFDGYAGVLGRALITQTWTLTLPELYRRMALPLAPVQSITSIEYYDTSGVQQTLDSSLYRLQPGGGWPYIERDEDATYPATDTRDDAVTITFVAGYGDAPSNVPAPLRQAIKILAVHLWGPGRDAVVTGMVAQVVPYSVDLLAAPYKRGTL